MRILINAIANAKGGGLRHLSNFLPALAKVDNHTEYLVYVNKNCPMQNRMGSNIKIFSVNIPNRPYRRFVWDQIVINRLAKKYNVSFIFSIFNYGTIHPHAKQIVWQNSPAFCDYYLQTSSIKERIIKNFQRLYAYLTMRASEIIIVPTVAWRDIIIKHCPHIPKEKFKVIPHGYDREKFSQGRDLPFEIEKMLKGSENRGPKLLLTCHPHRHKGFEFLFQALKIVIHKQANFRLFLTIKPEDWPGGIKAYQQKIKGLEKNIVTLGPISQDSIVNVYRKCDIFIFPSLCESFGFSMVEAMGVGLPIIVSDTAVNREICGNAALYFDPYDINDIAEKILMVIKDKRLREELSQKALKCAQEFPTWEQVARKTLEVIEEVQ